VLWCRDHARFNITLSSVEVYREKFLSGVKKLRNQPFQINRVMLRFILDNWEELQRCVLTLQPCSQAALLLPCR
jgi:hypothetical protein